eukprot:CAMPEP_0178625982 /NCGR_PEP_ID=MMETSP0698-20121128/8164_1 /TAXON_ID=265572 /ORGANISM="Extubocellulus spinifer, Strain CCMP396" /LENGTH=49 /DNA_ID= /DNA_START= /DNA_END= /DNA_ORIENTATION=
MDGSGHDVDAPAWTLLAGMSTTFPRGADAPRNDETDGEAPTDPGGQQAD